MPGGTTGIDVDELWAELGGSTSNKVIAGQHIPPAAPSANGGIRIGYAENGRNYPVELNSSGQAYVSVPWENTTYTLSSFGITATAAEINKLDGVGTLLHSGNYTSYVYSKSQADGRYMQIGTSGYNIAYKRNLTINGTAWSFLGTVNSSAAAFYAPATAGTSGYVLQSTGGTPQWISRAALQHELLAPGAGCLDIPADADLNDYDIPGVYYCAYNNTVGSWSNSPTENACSLTVLAAAGVIQILREYGYSSSAKEFTRRFYNGNWTAWVQTPRMSDVYTRTEADSRYLLKSSYTAADVLAKIKTVDGAGSGLDADLLDGTHKSGLLTSVTSTYAANLSVTVGGTVKSVADLHATYLRSSPQRAGTGYTRPQTAMPTISPKSSCT